MSQDIAKLDAQQIGSVIQDSTDASKYAKALTSTATFCIQTFLLETCVWPNAIRQAQHHSVTQQQENALTFARLTKNYLPILSQSPAFTTVLSTLTHMTTRLLRPIRLARQFAPRFTLLTIPLDMVYAYWDVPKIPFCSEISLQAKDCALVSASQRCSEISIRPMEGCAEILAPLDGLLKMIHWGDVLNSATLQLTAIIWSVSFQPTAQSTGSVIHQLTCAFKFAQYPKVPSQTLPQPEPA